MRAEPTALTSHSRRRTCIALKCEISSIMSETHTAASVAFQIFQHRDAAVCVSDMILLISHFKAMQVRRRLCDVSAVGSYSLQDFITVAPAAVSVRVRVVRLVRHNSTYGPTPAVMRCSARYCFVQNRRIFGAPVDSWAPPSDHVC